MQRADVAFFGNADFGQMGFGWAQAAVRITRFTVHTRETIKMDDGKEYPLMKLDVTSESHPFYTGAQQRIIETGRVEKFRQKFARTGATAAKA